MSADTPEIGVIPKPVLWRWVIRISVVVIMALLAWLALWSYFGRFLPAHRQFVEKSSTQVNLANEVQQLMIKWDDLDAKRTGERFELANASIFRNSNACEVWLQGVRDNSQSMALSVSPRLGKAETNTLKNLDLSLLRAEIQIEPMAAPALSLGPYHRLLGLTQFIEQSSKRVDFLELSVTGHSNSVAQASAVFQLWSHSSPSK